MERSTNPDVGPVNPTIKVTQDDDQKRENTTIEWCPGAVGLEIWREEARKEFARLRQSGALERGFGSPLLYWTHEPLTRPDRNR